MNIRWRTLLSLILLLDTCGCDRGKRAELSNLTIVGTYEGQYGPNATEVFRINSDGTFVQVFSKNGSIVYSNSGTWQINQQGVLFNRIMFAKDVWEINKGKPFMQDVYQAQWNSWGPSIVFAEDVNYWVTKVTTNSSNR